MIKVDDNTVSTVKAVSYLIGGVAVLFFAFFIFVHVPNNIREEVAAWNSATNKTPEGEFAIRSYDECKSSGGLFGDTPTTSGCVNQVIAAAQNLQGGEFAGKVSKILAQKILEDRKIRDYSPLKQ